MAKYVDGFVLPVPRRNVALYRRLAKQASKVWREYGALEYRECQGDDLAHKGVMPFPRGIRAKKNETVFFSWIVYRSRAHRDQVNEQIMKDPRILRMMKSKVRPFYPRRMLYGGFKSVVEA